MGHSRFAPSATEREYSCPASFLLVEGIPDHNSVDSAHGTAAHHVAALCLEHNHDCSLYAGCRVAVTDKGKCRFITEPHPLRDGEMAFEVDDEMVDAVQDYVDWCRESPGEHFTEVKLEHTKWCPDKDENGDKLGPQYGTSDHIAIYDGVLDVTDLKYGKGVKVFAKENKQGIKYALGALEEYGWMYDIKTVRIRICQPRLDHRDVWECTVEELLEWGAKIKKRLELVFVEDPPFGPSEKACKFCKVSGRCKALQAYIFAERALDFDDLTEQPISTKLLTDEELRSGWKMIPLLKIQIQNIEKEVMNRHLEGRKITGFKIVQSNTHRKWIDPDTVVEELAKIGIPRSESTKPKLISPNEAEELMQKKDRSKIAHLWIKPPGGATVVDESDPREEYDPNAKIIAEFDFDDGFGD